MHALFVQHSVFI